MKKPVPNGSPTKDWLSEIDSFDRRVKNGTFIPDKKGPKSGGMPGGPVIGTIVGPKSGDMPLKVILSVPRERKAVSPREAGGIDKIKKLFQDKGLAFPSIPAELATQLRELQEWVYSTRSIRKSAYSIDAYFGEAECGIIDDYAIIAYDGHGVNSLAIHYFLVYGPLNLFLQLGWGGAYMNADKDRNKIQRCFALADNIVRLITEAIQSPPNSPLHNAIAECRIDIYGSDFYGSRWSVSQDDGRKPTGARNETPPHEVLEEVLEWVTNRLRIHKKESVRPKKRLWPVAEVFKACEPHAKSVFEYIHNQWKELGLIVERGFGTIRLKVLINNQPLLLATLTPNQNPDPAFIHLAWNPLRRNKNYSETEIDVYQRDVGKLTKLRIGMNYADFGVTKDFSIKKAEKLVQAMARLAKSVK